MSSTTMTSTTTISTTTTSTPTNPIATITNSLGYDVDIYDVYNPNANASTKGPLTYTKLATVPNGASAQQVQTIHFASQLQAMRTGNITALNNNYYQQFPVAVLAVSTFGSTAFTLTSDMQQGMEQSFQFVKYAQANPSSQLATNFRTALGDGNSQKDAVNAFFTGTSSFPQCSLTTWTAVTSWQTQFTSPWQGTYYLYSLGNSSVGSTTGSSAPALVATLSIVASAQANSAVLTMAGTDNENTPVVMAGDGTMQEQNAGTGNLSVSLTPTWMNITQTSQQNGQAVTNYVIAAAFTGTINGMNVTGNLNKMAIPKPSDTSQNAADQNAANSNFFNNFMQVLGMLIQIGMLYYMSKDSKLAEEQKKMDAQKDATSKSDAKAKEAQIEADYQANDVSQVRAQAGELELTTVPKVADAYTQVDQAVKIQNEEAVIEKEGNKLMDVLEEEAPSQTTVDAATNLEKARTDLENATNPTTSAADREADVTDATTNLTSTTTEVNTELQNNGSELAQDEENALSDTTKALTEEQNQAEATEKNEEEQEQEDKNAPSEEVNPKEFDNPVEEVPESFGGE